MDWFKRLFGFVERSVPPAQMKSMFQVDELAGTLAAPTGKVFKIGWFTTPSLAELRAQAPLDSLPDSLRGKISVRNVRADVADLHAERENQYAVFQAASQFNCLEFVGPSVTPEMGVTRYAGDHTQGPACSIAAGPATVFRNYYARTPLPADVVPEEENTTEHSEPSKTKTWKIETDTEGRRYQFGQTAGCMLNMLEDIEKALHNRDSEGDLYFSVRGGYSEATQEQLLLLNEKLKTFTKDELDNLLSRLRIGCHRDVQVTATDWGRELLEYEQIVTQVFGSACAVGYSFGTTDEAWAPLACLVLRASYEATMYVALQNAQEHGNTKVYLTALGGGVFANPTPWITDAMRQAFKKFEHTNLDVRIVNYDRVPGPLARLANEFGANESEDDEM